MTRHCPDGMIRPAHSKEAGSLPDNFAASAFKAFIRG
jgi:hypothetical protein